MRNLWKFVVFACLFMQLGYAYSTNQSGVTTSQKSSKNALNKESYGSYQFLRPSIDRGTLDLKHNPRNYIGLFFCPNEFQSLAPQKYNNLKIAILDQDINRCTSVSILLFPFHYYW